MTTLEPTGYVKPHFSLLSGWQLQRLHLASMEVLRRTGVRFHHREALELLQKAGAFISEGNLVKFPARLVEEAIASVPRRIVMCDRDGVPALFLEGRNVYFGPGSDCVYFLDHDTGEHRQFTKTDLILGYRLCDALPNIDFLMSIGIPCDVETALAYDFQMALMLEHSTKPIVFVTGDKTTCKRAIDMAAAVAGGYETLREQQHVLLYSEPSTPLQQSETAIDKMLLMAEYELPVVHSPGAMMGATAPITMAGGITVMLAEALSGLVVHQLKRRGAPFVLGAGLHHLDMKTMQLVHPSPEFELTKAAIVQLGQWYGMPTWGYAGNSDSKVMDEQAALECMFSVMMAQLTGANLVHDVGYMESALATSFEMIVLTDEVIGMTDRFIQGIEVSDDSLLLDEIDRVGPGGNFLATGETLKRYREFWYPRLLDRNGRERWLEAGGMTLGQRLNARLKTIIAEGRSRPLAVERKEALRQILREAEQEVI